MSPQQPHPLSYDRVDVEKHTIETPEQTQLDFAIAGIGSRFVAMAIDSTIEIGSGLIIFIIAAIVAFFGRFHFIPQMSHWAFALFIGAGFLIYYGYYAFFEIIWNGQTPGKRWVGIRVVKDSGGPITVAESIGRNLLRIVDQLPAFYALGIVVALMNSRNKRLGDLLAGSMVVYEKSFIAAPWARSQNQAIGNRIGGERLSLEDLALIEKFLSRRHTLPEHIRSRMASDILRQLSPRFSRPAKDDVSTETLLETLAYERRSPGNS